MNTMSNAHATLVDQTLGPTALFLRLNAQAQALKLIKSINSTTMAVMPACCAKTQDNHKTVKAMGNPKQALKVTIQAPGLGIKLTAFGNQPMSNMGKDRPSPSIENKSMPCQVGILKASPIEAPMNGAVQGVAIKTDKAPLKNDSSH